MSVNQDSPEHTELSDLRKVIAEKDATIIRLIQAHGDYLMPMPETDLNEESIRAGSYYIEQKMKGAPMTERQLVVNAIAHGFFMGYRKCESNMIAKANGEKNVEPKSN